MSCEEQEIKNNFKLRGKLRSFFSFLEKDYFIKLKKIVILHQRYELASRYLLINLKMKSHGKIDGYQEER